MNKNILSLMIFSIALQFNSCKSSELAEFEITGADKKYVPATAKIVENKIQLFSLLVPKPKYARYACRDKSVASLFNKEGLPASSFSTEN
jgi:sialate O-acetylesterase